MKRALIAFIAIFAGCGSSSSFASLTNPLISDDGEILAGRSSSISEVVLAALEVSAPSHLGHTWNVSTDNALDEGWLLQTPPEDTWGKTYEQLTMTTTCKTADCDPDFQLQRCQAQSDCTLGGRCAEVAATVHAPGGTPQKLCVGHSDSLVDDYYKLIVSGERFVDVTSLTPPDGRFEAAVRNATTYLASTGRAMQVRLLFGDFPVQGVVNAKAVLASLVRDVPAHSPIHVYVGNYRSSDGPRPSWNHSKMVAVDGRAAIVGGHNMWSLHYLGKNPVHDLSLELHGSAAADAHRFANEQWRYTCSHRSLITYLTWSVWANDDAGGKIGDRCPPQYDLPAVSGPGKATMIAVGRLAGIDGSGGSNQSDTAMLALLGAATRTIRLSLQDLGPPTVPGLGLPLGHWPEKTFDQLTRAIARGVDVYIVVSDQHAVAGGLAAVDAPYNNGWSTTDVAKQIQKYMIDHPQPNDPSGAELRALLCRKLHVAPLRFSTEDRFPDGAAYPNHAKLILVDEQAFYLGSQNLYDANLTEYGYIVDDARAAADLVRGYWSKLWQYSQARAVTGSEAERCVL
jgi:phosphatidylserine/phosphatidylglycerophosphate/cardiolipin synthase-like enzyme